MYDARVVGPGRAGTALSTALARAGWTVDGPLGRDTDLADAANGCVFLVLAVPDVAIAEVAESIPPGDAVVCHLSGSLTARVIATHPRVAALHPLVAIPAGPTGAERLPGVWFAVDGDPDVSRLVEALDGRPVEVRPETRTAYHAAAVVASNHLVALLGQVERIARSIDVPLDAYLDLARGALDNVATLGPADALTGPVARGDWDTVRRHLETIAIDERPAYVVLADQAARLVDGRASARSAAS